ncbi:hypothetical protein FRX31_034436 [Thalictrum thalictroides]|uniref:Uncharacterized protein n=1 Tax=Thalictrum thalictroides TaxID=46969 RepID=A0A7J6UTP4_THATH|nr:hypothetical protein FRX31_034436 [Thalictrum thalictroides]
MVWQVCQLHDCGLGDDIVCIHGYCRMDHILLRDSTCEFKAVMSIGLDMRDEAHIAINELPIGHSVS